MHTQTLLSCPPAYTGYMNKLPDYQCTPGLLPMVMVRPLRDQRTHFNSSRSMQISHSDRPLWTCLYPKCKMVVSLKCLQDSSRGTKLVCVKWHHRWCTKLTRSSLIVVSTSHAVNGCSPRVPLVSHSQTTFFFYIEARYKRKMSVVWL